MQVTQTLWKRLKPVRSPSLNITPPPNATTVACSSNMAVEHLAEAPISTSEPTVTNGKGVDPSRPVTVAVIGAGQRGKNYAVYAHQHPSECAIVAVAEPRPKSRAHFASTYGIDKTLAFNDWKDLLAAARQTSQALPGTRLADAIVVSVQDAMHMEVVLAFAELGYPILCEKPMATSVQDCLNMHDAVKRSGIIFGMGHGLYIFYYYTHS